MKSILLLIIIHIITPSVASADIDLNSNSIAIYVPHLKWKLKFPSSDWKLAQEKRRPDGTGYYYHLTSESAPLNFSVFLDKTKKCKSPDECRDMFWSNPGSEYKDPKDVVKKTANGFSVIQFYLDLPMGYPVVQSNISAHNYRDGYWIDIHLSKVSKQSPDYTEMNKFINDVIIE